GDDFDFVGRPGSAPLEEQLDRVVAVIKSRRVGQKAVLFDGYSLTGRTLTEVKSLIRSKDSNCAIDEFIALCNSKSPPSLREAERRPCLGLVECRDFLVGAREGGLVVRVPLAG